MPASCANTLYNHCRRAQCIDSYVLSLKLMYWKIRLLKMFTTKLSLPVVECVRRGILNLNMFFNEFAEQKALVIACTDCS